MGDRLFFAGDSVTHPDFFVYELFWAHRKMAPGTIEKFPNLVQFMNRLEALPRICDYIKTDKFLKSPINNRMAGFGSKAI